MYTLYYSPTTASMAVHLTLLEIGAPYHLEKIDFGLKQQRDPRYLSLNPQGKIPTLVIDGQPYTESAALVLILADRHPEAGLAPKPGTARRNEWYQWIVDMSTVLGGTFRHWFYPTDLGAADHPDAVRSALQGQIESAWTRLDTHLAGNGPYLLRDSISAADLLLIMYMRWSRRMPNTALDWPALKAFADRIRQRESWQRLCDIEELEEWRS
jgi:glutathione S-transferase